MSKTFKIPNDYNIYSALSTGKVSDSVLTALFLKRGIILSNQTNRENKADYFSSFMHGYDDFETISAQYSKTDRSEYTSSTNLTTELKINDLVPIMTTIESSLEKNLPNIQLKNVEPNLKNGILTLEFEYEKFHPEKQMFAQIENKKAVLTFKKDEDTQQIYLEHSATPEMIKWTGAILENLKEYDQNLNIDNIDLTGLTDPSLYWNFFDELTKSFATFIRSNVVEVLFKDPNKEDNDEDDGIYKLISASYRGHQLHLSDDFMAKLNDGYRLYKFTWDCLDSSVGESDKYRLSIKVTYDESGKNYFSFISKGLYKAKEGKFLKTPQPLPLHLESQFKKIIFKNGMELINSLTSNTLKINFPEMNNELVDDYKEEVK